MEKSHTRKKLILSLSQIIAQAVSEMGKDEIRITYPAGGEYAAFPETNEGRIYLDTFVRRRDVPGSWEMLKRFALLSIKIRIRIDKNAKRKEFDNFANSSSILRDKIYPGC